MSGPEVHPPDAHAHPPDVHAHPHLPDVHREANVHREAGGVRPGRRVLVSGGTSGIGYACAEHLVSRGDQVWILGSDEQRLEVAVARMRPAGASVCDVSVPGDVEAAVGAASAALGALDGVFVNAGIDGEGVPARDIDADHFRRVLDVNVVGAFLVARAALRVLERPGAIVFNASVNALRPEASFLDYNASKAAVVSVAKSLALEVSAEAITVTAVCPGYFPTPMTAPYLDDPVSRRELLERIPAGRFGSLGEIAALVDFLLSRQAAYMAGSVISIDGGSSI
jgi:NAD(P)-dependent dehydrogenase (short-subunit alcohol dehydrogenase family)